MVSSQKVNKATLEQFYNCLVKSRADVSACGLFRDVFRLKTTGDKQNTHAGTISALYKIPNTDASVQMHSLPCRQTQVRLLHTSSYSASTSGSPSLCTRTRAWNLSSSMAT